MINVASAAWVLLGILIGSAYLFTFLPLLVNYLGPDCTKVQKRNLSFLLRVPAFVILCYAFWF